MEGLISIGGRWPKDIRIIFSSKSQDLYINCDDVEQVSKHSYSVWERFSYGKECILSAEKYHRSLGCTSPIQYMINDGEYKGRWLRVDLVYIFLDREVGQVNLLSTINKGVMDFTEEVFNSGFSLVRVYHRTNIFSMIEQKIGVKDCVMQLKDKIYLLLSKKLPSVGQIVLLKTFHTSIQDSLDGKYKERKIFKKLIEDSEDFEIIRRSVGVCIKRIK